MVAATAAQRRDGAGGGVGGIGRGDERVRVPRLERRGRSAPLVGARDRAAAHQKRRARHVGRHARAQLGAGVAATAHPAYQRAEMLAKKKSWAAFGAHLKISTEDEGEVEA